MKPALLQLGFVLFALSTLARGGGTLAVRNFGAADGLGEGAMHRIVADSRGFVWFCSDSGLSRFDGDNFVRYGPHEGLPAGPVHDIVEEADHATYMVATQTGLFRLDGAAARADRRIFEPVSLPLNGAVRRLLLDRRGRLWVGLSSGVAVFGSLDRRNARRILPDALPQVRTSTTFALVEARDGSIWTGTHGSGVFQISADLATVINYPMSHRGLYFVRDLLVGPDGRIWCAFLGGVARFRAAPDGTKTPVEQIFDPVRQLASIDTSLMAVGPAGEILVATYGGVNRIAADRSGVWRVMSRWSVRDGLSSDVTSALGFDRRGNLWIGTLARGAMCVALGGFRRHSQIEAEGARLVGLLTQERDGPLALADLAHRGYRLHRINEVQTDVIDIRLPPDIDYLGWGIHRMARDRHGGVWLATGAGLLHYAGTNEALPHMLRRSPRRYRIAEGLPGTDVYWVRSDAHGEVWASVAAAEATFSSLAHYDRRTDRFHTYAGELPAAAFGLATAFANDRIGQTWIGFGKGRLCRFDRDGRPTLIELQPSLAGAAIVDLVFDSRGQLWIVTAPHGIHRVSDPAPALLRATPGPTELADDAINCITEDKRGRLYFGTDRGVVRFDPQSTVLRRFRRTEGLPSDSITHCACDLDGNLWFGDLHGLARLVPTNDPPLPTPRAWIAALSIDGAGQPVPALGTESLGPLRLSAGSHRVAVQVFAIDDAGGEPLRFQYSLDPQTGWSEPTDSRTLEFPQLGSGRHRLQVRVAQVAEAAMPPARLELVIPTPFWRSAWFLVLATASLLAAIYYAYRLRLARLLAVERMRTRIATDLHDAVGADLSRISLMAEAAQHDLAAQTAQAQTVLADVAQSARDAVREMSDIVWALKPGRDDLAQVVMRLQGFAADLVRSANSSFRVETNVELESLALQPEACRELYLLLKEALNNALRHAAARVITLEIRAVGRGLQLELRDDGRGFDPAQRQPSRGGHGLGSLEVRAARLGGRLAIDSAPGQGTRIRLELPRA